MTGSRHAPSPCLGEEQEDLGAQDREQGVDVLIGHLPLRDGGDALPDRLALVPHAVGQQPAELGSDPAAWLSTRRSRAVRWCIVARIRAVAAARSSGGPAQRRKSSRSASGTGAVSPTTATSSACLSSSALDPKFAYTVSMDTRASRATSRTPVPLQPRSMNRRVAAPSTVARVCPACAARNGDS